MCFLILVSITGCDKRKDFYSTINESPKIEMRKQGTPLFVTGLNDSIKKMFPDYYLELKVTDEEKLPLNYSLTNLADKFSITNNVGRFTPDTTKLGTHGIVFTTTDSYKVTTTAMATFVVFDNLPPVALFTAAKQAVYDPLQYNIDASASYDGDSKYGGKIVEYEFTINTSYKVNTGFNNINYIFPAAGNYTLSVRVKDNNGVWSVPKRNDLKCELIMNRLKLTLLKFDFSSAIKEKVT